MTKEDYLEWLDNPVTKELAKNVGEAAEKTVELLVLSRDNTHSEDSWYKGFIAGIQEVLAWKPEFPEEEVTDGIED